MLVHGPLADPVGGKVASDVVFTGRTRLTATQEEMGTASSIDVAGQSIRVGCLWGPKTPSEPETGRGWSTCAPQAMG
jgi:hypothetical protein